MFPMSSMYQVELLMYAFVCFDGGDEREKSTRATRECLQAHVYRDSALLSVMSDLGSV